MEVPFLGCDLTRQRLRGRAYTRLLRGVYVKGSPEPAVEVADPAARAARRLAEVRQRTLAAMLVLPGSTACWHTGALLQRLPVPDCVPVHLARAPRRSTSERPGVVVHRMTFEEDELLDLDGVPASTASRTFVDLAGVLHRLDLIALGDAALRRDGEADMAQAVERAAGRRGVAAARLALPLLDVGALSPAESRARIRAHEAGFTGLRHGVVVNDRAGQWLAAPDLADEVARVAVQHDGEVHQFTDKVQKRRGDIMRDENTRDEGWQVVVVTAREDKQPHLFLDRLANAYLRQARLLGDHVLPPHLLARQAA